MDGANLLHNSNWSLPLCHLIILQYPPADLNWNNMFLKHDILLYLGGWKNKIYLGFQAKICSSNLLASY